MKARFSSIVGLWSILTISGAVIAAPADGVSGATTPAAPRGNPAGGRLIGVSRIDALPPIPARARQRTEAQLLGVPVPIYLFRSDEEKARGSPPRSAGQGGIVYRQSHDTGLYEVTNDATDNFIGNLLHLGNGFPQTGGEISGYDLLIYNSAESTASADVSVTLWDGDPLGLIDTRISDPPQAIPGTLCTFTGLGPGGEGSNGCVNLACDGGFLDGQPCSDDLDCGLCPAIAGDDIPECPGLYRLACDLDPKVVLPSRNVWIVMEVTDGCRVGWRWAMNDAPDVAATGEDNLCPPWGASCLAGFGPCVDLVVELVDGASQWSSVGVGTCCEDGSACDHSDGGYECTYEASCTDGVADDTDVFCFGAPAYYASFVASVYGMAAKVSLLPVGGARSEITVYSGAEDIELQIMIEDWDPYATGSPLRLTVWQATIDSSGYTSGPVGTLVPSTPACTAAEDCPFFAQGSTCSGGFCTAGFQDCGPGGPSNNACLDLPAIDVSTLDYRYGSTVVASPAMADPGKPVYGGTLLLKASADADGTFEVGFLPDPATFLKDENSLSITPLVLVPAVINVLPSVVIPAGQDCWETECGLTQHSFVENAIPADFFGPGSEPFEGSVQLKGSGEGDDGYDIAIERAQDMVFDPLKLPSTQDTPIKIAKLDLVSCEPIDVMVGATTTSWNVRVGLSTVHTDGDEANDPPVGAMTVVRTHANGGVYTGYYYVLPRYTFVNVNDGSDVRVFDTGAEGLEPQRTVTMGHGSWVHQTTIPDIVACGENFVIDVNEEEVPPGSGRAGVPPPQSLELTGWAPPGSRHYGGQPVVGEAGRADGIVKTGACCLPTGVCELVSSTKDRSAKYICQNEKGGCWTQRGTKCTRDTDGDGIPNVFESAAGCGTLGPGECENCAFGTKWNDPDHDDDGCRDGDEVNTLGTGPCDPCAPEAGCPDGGGHYQDCIQHSDPFQGISNGIPDACDIGLDGAGDCNNNGIFDECDAGLTGACCGSGSGCGMITKQACLDLDASGSYDWVFRRFCTECPADLPWADHDGVWVQHYSGPPPACQDDKMERGTKAECADPPYYIDPWLSNPDATTCHQFGNGAPGIPADFFGPGSDPFEGLVCLIGVPLGHVDPYGEFAEADTLIKRSDDPFDRCALPLTQVAGVDIEIVALHLESVAPIVVTYNGGQDAEVWDASVGLSIFHTDEDPNNDPPRGSITAEKTHCNGGTYNSVLPVLPKFTFTRQSDQEQQELDFGPEGFEVITLVQDDNPPWLHDPPPELVLAADPCTDFFPGAVDTAPVYDCDCDGNDVRDKCDLESESIVDCNGNEILDVCEAAGNDCDEDGILDECETDCNGNDVPDNCEVPPPAGNCTEDCLPDCNENGLPDECEPDCNGNGLADACDIGIISLDCQPNNNPDECDLASGVSQDCNNNDIPDECDIAVGVLIDRNGDGVPDVCQCVVAAVPVHDSSPAPVNAGFGTKNRYLSFAGTEIGARQAVRVTFMSLPGYEYAEGRTMWVQEPYLVTEASCCNDSSPTPTFWAAELGCDPAYIVWSNYGIVDVYGDGVVPSATFAAQAIDIVCPGVDVEEFYSAPLNVVLSASGDVVGDCGPTPCTAPQGVIDFVDISAVVEKFRNLPDAPRKARADVINSDVAIPIPDQKIDFVDISCVVEAFRGFPCTLAGPPIADPCVP